MQQSRNNGYIERLVIKYIIQNIGLEILVDADEQDRSSIFLRNIGWSQKKDYIEDTLNAYLSEFLLKGNLYVFTPDDSFKYESVNGRLRNIGIRESRDASSTFNDALNDILMVAEANRRAGKPTVAQVLYFDRTSKIKFEDQFRKRLKLKGQDYSVEQQYLNVAGYDKIRLYNYVIKTLPQSDR